MIHRSRCLAFVLAGSLSPLAGCEDKLTLENYEQITTGMTLTQVEEILGEGVEQKSEGGFDISAGGILSSGGGTSTSPVKMYTWGQGGLLITVYFRDGAVVTKSQNGLN